MKQKTKSANKDCSWGRKLQFIFVTYQSYEKGVSERPKVNLNQNEIISKYITHYFENLKRTKLFKD